MTMIVDPHAAEQAEQERIAALRSDLGVRCDFLAARAENSKDAMSIGASNVLKVLGWCLKKNDMYTGGVLKQVEEVAKLAHLVMIRLEAVHQAHIQGGIVAPSGAEVVAIDRSKVS